MALKHELEFDLPRISVDYGKNGGDWTAEVDWLRKSDGTIHILDVRRYRETIDLVAVDLTKSKTR